MDFEDMIVGWYPTGSRFICDPPPTDTDNDTVILVLKLDAAKIMLLNDGWTICGDDEYEEDKFIAFRKGEDNYIVTEDTQFFMNYVKATNAAKALNLTNKNDRVMLFKSVLSMETFFHTQKNL